MMKRRDIEKQLKREAQEHTPELYDRIAASAKSEGLLQEQTQNEAIRNQGNTAVLLQSKKRRAVVIAVSLLFAILFCLAIVLPIVLKGTKDSPFTPKITLSANDVYGMGAVSTVRLLGGNTSAQAIGNFSAATTFAAKNEAADEENEVKAQAKKFNEYFTALDSFLGDDVVTTVSEANTDENYPYETKLTITGKDFDGESVQYLMYFTETLVPSDNDDDDETENEYALKGIMVVDGADYYLEGARSIEQEKDETENELKIRAYADPSDKTNFVEMEQEHSVENNETETEYVYSVYSGGTLVEQTAVEFGVENKNKKEEVEYELEFRKGEAKGKYSIERETKNGKSQIKVKYDIDGKQGAFRIALTEQKGYTYLFSDGTSATL